MVTAFLLLGANIGDRLQHLQDARLLLARYVRPVDSLPLISEELHPVKLIRQSQIYETAAWGKIEQDDYLNQAIEISTNLSPQKLLKATSAIETRLGRTRKKVWDPRIIDIDILFYGNEIIREEKLVIPHPHLQNRRFVLKPLAEIAPRFMHPVLKKSTATLLATCPDPLWVKKYEGYSQE